MPGRRTVCRGRLSTRSRQDLAFDCAAVYAAYDVGGTGKTVIKGGWGRFNHVRTEDEVLPLHPFVATVTTYRWRDLNGNRDYNPGEVDLDVNGPDFVQSIVRDTGNLTSSAVTNPDEKQPGIDQFTLTLEHELAGNLAARVSGVHSHSFNEPRRLNQLRPYDAYSIPVTNPDPGRMGDRDHRRSGPVDHLLRVSVAIAGRDFQRTVLVADTRSNETHDTIEVALTKRMSSRWQLMGSYSATKNDALAPKTRGTAYHAAAALDPNTEYNTGDHTWEWLARVSGIYSLPAQINLSANFDHRSGLPTARQVLLRGGVTIPSITLNADPLGSLRLPNTNVLDVRADKSFSLFNKHRLTVRANVFNVLNANAVTALTVLSGANYLRPTAILSRIVEFSASVQLLDIF